VELMFGEKFHAKKGLKLRLVRVTP
jgi:hypothetical protein